MNHYSLCDLHFKPRDRHKPADYGISNHIVQTRDILELIQILNPNFILPQPPDTLQLLNIITYTHLFSLVVGSFALTNIYFLHT